VIREVGLQGKVFSAP